ncbi:CHASE domain-containing protein [Psychromonas sp. SR45-3]|uniref:sensor histidine kinase n=1 Tax=Psychromonas sp. SR45-3 TaxID=2760930 RepID=UPI0015FA82B4|nr:CHASE domain-containing protein [Psychromonas sp. SR45-3]MBB1274031.1 CHASE domain-containing protein [Psychromonas sp. SR45-3]
MNIFSIKPLLLAIVISFIGIFSTYTISLKVTEQLKAESYEKIENIAKQVSSHFQDAIDKSINDLQGLQAFYSANKQHFSQLEFNQYMDVLDINQRGYIQAMSWVPLVKSSEKERFEALIRAQQPDFDIMERDAQGKLVKSKVRPHYTPVAYVSNYQVNKQALGFDLNSNDIRRQSLELARDSGRMTTTAKIKLIQETGSSAGFLIIAPVYQQDLPIDTKEQRITALIGYATGVFRIDTLMENAKARADIEALELSLLDINQENGGSLYGQIEDKDFFSFDINIPDRQWQLNIALNDMLLKNIESPTVIKWILFGGIVISLLLAFAIYALQVAVIRAKNISHLSEALQNQNSQLEKKVADRTQSLADKNAQLKTNIDELTTQRALLSSLMKEADAAKVLAELRSVDLARSNKDLDEFAYVASHDLKAPLRGIDQLATWVVEDLEEGNLEEIPAHLKMMRNRIKRLETLLNDLLTYSRANRQQNSISDIDSKVVINDLFSLVAPLEGFTLTIKDNLPRFSTYRAPFEQVVRNLLSNAIKHHDKEQGHIQIGCTETDEFYVFSIEDDGPGISPNYHEDIFKMFKTLRPRDETEGSGMGLALIKKIVEHYSGEVIVKSVLGQGCTFYFSWPKGEIESSMMEQK